MQPRILCLPGSARQHSSNAALLRHFAVATGDRAKVDIYENMARLPIFNPDLEAANPPTIIRELESAVRTADALVIACPEYAHGIPGGFKNLLDWLVSGDALYGKPTLLIHANGRGRGDFVRAALVEVLETVGVNLIDRDAASFYLVAKNPPEVAEILSSPQSQAKLAQVAGELVTALSSLRQAGYS